MKKREKIFVALSFVLQVFLGNISLGLIFSDSRPNNAELAFFIGLIFLVHGLALFVFKKKGQRTALVTLIFGFITLIGILVLQNLVGRDWFITGVGGVSLEAAVNSVIFHTLTSVGTLIVLKQKSLFKVRNTLKQTVLFLVPAWILLIPISISVYPFFLNNQKTIVDFYDQLHFFLKLLIAPFFLLIIPFTGIPVGLLAILFLSLYLIRGTKHLGKIFIVLLAAAAVIMLITQKPFVNINMKPLYPVWNYDTIPVYTFNLSGIELKAPCPVKPVITDTAFRCDNDLLVIEAIQDAGFAYSLASSGASIAVPEKTDRFYVDVSPFNNLGIFKNDNCQTLMPRIAYEQVRLDFHSTACKQSAADSYIDDWGNISLHLFMRISFPKDGFVSEY